MFSLSAKLIYNDLFPILPFRLPSYITQVIDYWYLQKLKVRFGYALYINNNYIHQVLKNFYVSYTYFYLAFGWASSKNLTQNLRIISITRAMIIIP